MKENLKIIGSAIAIGTVVYNACTIVRSYKRLQEARKVTKHLKEQNANLEAALAKDLAKEKEDHKKRMSELSIQEKISELSHEVTMNTLKEEEEVLDKKKEEINNIMKDLNNTNLSEEERNELIDELKTKMSKLN